MAGALRCRGPAGSGTNSADSRPGPAEQLDQGRPGAENRSAIRVLIAELWLAASRSSRASRVPTRRAGSTNTGSRTSAASVTCQEIPPSLQGQRERHQVADHTGQGVAERPLRADDVVVQPADQRTRVGTGEESDRHALHMVEHPVRSRRMSPSPISPTATARPPHPGLDQAAIRRSAPDPTTTPSAAPLTMRRSPGRPAPGSPPPAPSQARSQQERAQSAACGRANPLIRRKVAKDNGRRSCWACMV